MGINPREAEERRRARASWPIARHRLGGEPPDDLSEVTTPAQRIAMMWELAAAAWKAAGRPWPTYDRRHIPARYFPPGSSRPDTDDA